MIRMATKHDIDHLVSLRIKEQKEDWKEDYEDKYNDMRNLVDIYPIYKKEA